MMLRLRLVAFPRPRPLCELLLACLLLVPAVLVRRGASLFCWWLRAQAVVRCARCQWLVVGGRCVVGRWLWTVVVVS